MATAKLLEGKEMKNLWEMVVEHPFVKDMVGGKLEHDKFRDYIVQDKMFCHNIRGLVCSILASFGDSSEFDEFHQAIADLRGYRKETELFDDMFSNLKIPKTDLRAHFTTEAFCNFVVRVSTSGSLEDKLILLYAIEASYMEWAERARKNNQVPSDPLYEKWTSLHYSDNLGRLVNWIEDKLTELLGSKGERLTHHHATIMKRTLQYEIMFFDTAYRPGSAVFPGEFGIEGDRPHRAAGKLIRENADLWDQVVEHELITDMFEDTLSIEKFRDYMIQLRVIVGEGMRSILCRLLADCHPEQTIAASIIGHIQSTQPGGDHFDAIAEMLRATGSPEITPVLPATQAIVDYLYVIGLNGTVHEKVLAMTTLVEITNARFQLARDEKRLPMNPIYSSWFAHHSASILRPRVEWLHTALDATVTSSINEQMDKRMFRRIVQWVLIMNDSVYNRGRWEWAIESKYYHKRELALHV